MPHLYRHAIPARLHGIQQLLEVVLHMRQQHSANSVDLGGKEDDDPAGGPESQFWSDAQGTHQGNHPRLAPKIHALPWYRMIQKCYQSRNVGCSH